MIDFCAAVPYNIFSVGGQSAVLSFVFRRCGSGMKNYAGREGMGFG